MYGFIYYCFCDIPINANNIIIVHFITFSFLAKGRDTSSRRNGGPRRTSQSLRHDATSRPFCVFTYLINYNMCVYMSCHFKEKKRIATYICFNMFLSVLFIVHFIIFYFSAYGETTLVAEEMAARDALRNLFGTTLHRDPFTDKRPLDIPPEHYSENYRVPQYFEKGRAAMRA